MLKKLLRCVCFIAGMLGLLYVLSVVITPKVDIYNVSAVNRKSKDIKNEKKDSIDVIILGDSEAYSAFSPLDMWGEDGISTYVCGSSAQRLCDTWQIMNAAFENQKPKVIVLETNCLFRSAAFEGGNGDETLDFLGKYFPVFKYHNRWKSFIPDFENEKGKDAREEAYYKGFKVRKSVEAYDGKPYMIKTDDVEEISAPAQDYLARIKKFADDNGVKLVLVSVVSPLNYTYEKHNGIEQWSIQNNVEYLDLNLIPEELNINWSEDYKDGGNHLNYTGAKKVSVYLADYLKNNYDLTDHRNDAEYAEWNKVYEELKDRHH